MHGADEPVIADKESTTTPTITAAPVRLSSTTVRFSRVPESAQTCPGSGVA